MVRALPGLIALAGFAVGFFVQHTPPFWRLKRAHPAWQDRARSTGPKPRRTDAAIFGIIGSLRGRLNGTESSCFAALRYGSSVCRLAWCTVLCLSPYSWDYVVLQFRRSIVLRPWVVSARSFFAVGVEPGGPGAALHIDQPSPEAFLKHSPRAHRTVHRSRSYRAGRHRCEHGSPLRKIRTH